MASSSWPNASGRRLRRPYPTVVPVPGLGRWVPLLDRSNRPPPNGSTGFSTRLAHWFGSEITTNGQFRILRPFDGTFWKIRRIGAVTGRGDACAAPVGSELEFIAQRHLERAWWVAIEPRQIQRAVETIRTIVPLGVRTRVEHVEDAEAGLEILLAGLERASQIELQITRRLVQDLPVAACAVREAICRRQRV